MKHALVKISTELYAPGAVVRNRTLEWMSGWELQHTRRVIYPVIPLPAYVAWGVDRSIITQDIAHIRFIPLDDTYAGPLDSELDVLLSSIRLDYFLGDELARIANVGLMHAAPYQEGVTFAAWMELWEFDPVKGKGQALREVTMQQILEKAKAA
jgi:hypothetical protein